MTLRLLALALFLSLTPATAQLAPPAATQASLPIVAQWPVLPC